MPSYRTPPDDVAEVLATVLEKHHPDLLEAGVTFQLLGAHAKLDKNGVAKGAAIKHHGYPALAVVSLFSLKDRVGGSPDCRIVIDADQWEDHADAKRHSLIHHECLHVEVVRDEGGTIQVDDACRPRLKLRPHDVEIGVFWDAVKNYGDDSWEAEAWKTANRQMTQLLLFDKVG